MNYQYWSPELETMSRSDIEALQLARLREAVGLALRTTFYRDRLAGAGIREPGDIASLADLRRIDYPPGLP
jgi:phenylacetate-CoA ligase